MLNVYHDTESKIYSFKCGFMWLSSKVAELDYSCKTISIRFNPDVELTSDEFKDLNKAVCKVIKELKDNNHVY